ncbi:MAG: hypothetical protein DIU78_015755 [Pseudomonadota bacterium]
MSTGFGQAADTGRDLEFEGGWLVARKLLVASDGTRSLGDADSPVNTTRDRGSKIVFFDPRVGNNETAEVYWWNGREIVDARGRPANDAGARYGDDPLQPNLAAIRPFEAAIGLATNRAGDPRLRTHAEGFEATAGGYPDWFLFRRGRVHDTFDGALVGGRSRTEPMVIAAYGPLADGRAVIAPAEKTITFRGDPRASTNPLSEHNHEAPESWLHLVLLGLEVRAEWSHLYAHRARSPAGGPVTAYAEDCKWVGGNARLVYLPRETTVRRSVVAFQWNADQHSVGYYTDGFEPRVTFEEVVFYRNGYKNDPLRTPDPRRDVFGRNIYEGGGAQMGHTYRGIVSADGASGGPQMRLGGTCENSLIVEGYWYSSTQSNESENAWLVAGKQSGQSAVVRNNVHLVLRYPTPADPDSARASDPNAQPGWGYRLAGASFGAVVEGNIVSAAMLENELGAQGQGGGLVLAPYGDVYQDGNRYTQQRNVVRNNIVYRMPAGLELTDDWTGVRDVAVTGNVFVADTPVVSDAKGLTAAEQLAVRGNRFYTANAGLPQSPIFGADNALRALSEAKASERWPDPDRTLRRYVTERLGLTLLDWTDDPYLPAEVARQRKAAGEAYDPTGLKTFMAVATNMRRGGRTPAPTSGKPSWTGDYAWDARFTAESVVNWVREGFGLPPVPRTEP